MAIITSLVKAYAQAIYLDGTKKFSEIRPEYAESVKQHAAAIYTQEQLDNALAKGYVTQQEYDETIGYKTVSP
ncbi:hypothetical protein V7152_15010 [Neobacillus drentensis]|uniref:hypothetical protein n=1 Tax=Neobacillus drentensis TaxID=220684 RepID=UPI002FFF8E7F